MSRSRVADRRSCRRRARSTGAVLMKDAQPKAIRLAEYQPPSHIDHRYATSSSILRDGVTQVTSRLERDAQRERVDACGSMVRNSNSCRSRSTAGALTSNEYQVDDDSLTLFDLAAKLRVDRSSRAFIPNRTSRSKVCTNRAAARAACTARSAKPKVSARSRTTSIVPTCSRGSRRRSSPTRVIRCCCRTAI